MINYPSNTLSSMLFSSQGPVNVDRSMSYSKVQQNQNTGLPDVIIPLKSVCHLSRLLTAGVQCPGECQVWVKAPPCVQAVCCHHAVCCQVMLLVRVLAVLILVLIITQSDTARHNTLV